jgi:alginate O-acetyltransferase complex protein AlgJ
MSTNTKNSYALVFILAVISLFALVMYKSLEGGFANFEIDFYKKKSLIAMFNEMKYGLGDRVFPQVLVGQDGFLEFTSDGSLDDYQNARPLQERLEGIYGQLLVLNRDLKAKGITLLVVVPPNKATIYPDKVPSAIQKVGEQSRLDFFISLLQGPDAPLFVDLRPSLQQARQERQIYYKTDTHWNSYGAYVAYREIMDDISQVYPDVHPHALEDFVIEEGDSSPRDLARLMGLDFIVEPNISVALDGSSDAYFQRIPPLSNISFSWADSGSKEKLLVYHDSFGDAINNFLQYSFSEVVYVHNGQYECPATGSWIDTFKPDVVVIEVVERDLIYLDDLLDHLLCE